MCDEGVAAVDFKEQWFLKRSYMVFVFHWKGIIYEYRKSTPICPKTVPWGTSEVTATSASAVYYTLMVEYYYSCYAVNQIEIKCHRLGFIIII